MHAGEGVGAYLFEPVAANVAGVESSAATPTLRSGGGHDVALAVVRGAGRPRDVGVDDIEGSTALELSSLGGGMSGLGDVDVDGVEGAIGVGGNRSDTDGGEEGEGFKHLHSGDGGEKRMVGKRVCWLDRKGLMLDLSDGGTRRVFVLVWSVRVYCLLDKRSRYVPFLCHSNLVPDHPRGRALGPSSPPDTLSSKIGFSETVPDQQRASLRSPSHESLGEMYICLS